MKRLLFVVVIAALVTAFYFLRLAPQPEPSPVPVPASDQSSEPAEPQVCYPLPEVTDAPAETDAGEAAGDEAEDTGSRAKPLPPLEDSDRYVLDVANELFGPEADAFFSSSAVVHRAAVTVDNLPQSQVPPRFRVIRRVPGTFQVDERDDRIYLSERNYQRYLPYVERLEGADAETIVSEYIRLYPLFQAAFSQMGYGEAYFNDRVVEVIDLLLATPEVEQPVRLVQPSVMYKFADPKLEALPAGQKMLIRMGPDNAARVKAKLREIRAALMARVEKG